MDRDLQVLLGTMTVEIAYEGMKKTELFSHLPELNGRGEITPTMHIVQEVALMSPAEIRKVVEDSSVNAHRLWRNQLEVLRMMRDDRFWSCSNCFAPLELAGPEASFAWFGFLYALLKPLGADFAQDLSRKDAGYLQQFEWLTGIDCLLPPMFRMIFLDRREKFVESEKLKTTRDLYEYIVKNDVLEIRPCVDDDEETKREKSLNLSLLYDESGNNITFSLAKAIMNANNGLFAKSSEC